MKFRPKTQEWAFLRVKNFCDETQQYTYQKIHIKKFMPGKKIILPKKSENYFLKVESKCVPEKRFSRNFHSIIISHLIKYGEVLKKSIQAIFEN